MSRLKFLAGIVVTTLLIMILAGSCRQKVRVLKSPPGFNFASGLTHKLDKKLLEISGIVWDSKNDEFIVHNDEDGMIFYLEKETKLIKAGREFRFAGKGDYEDITIANGTPYILVSNGSLIRIAADNTGKKFGLDMGKLPLSGTNDFESLYYDASRKALVMICKNCELDDDNSVSAFAYYPDSIGFDPKPLYVINAAEINKLSPRSTAKFQPSGAAINPLTKKVFILSSASNQLAVTSLDGKVEGVYMLSKKLFPQPEGITFKPKGGEMYISNEGLANRESTVIKFIQNDSVRSKALAQKKGYDLSAPDDKMELDDKLHEISGLAYLPDEDLILAENDEKGTIYTVDFKGKTIEASKLKFGGKGDYEDIVHTDSVEYLLVSPGSIVEVRRARDTAITTLEYTLDAGGTNEFEAMYMDSARKGIVLICKECAKEKDKIRRAYLYDMVTHRFSLDPLYNISILEIQTLLNDSKAEFKPSAAAINPVTGQLFIVASVGKLLVIADRNGKVQQAIKLDPQLFNQPEGLTFAPNGDLYISNEGGEGIATILRFAYNSNVK
jgi:uncharacterized protein YjiK